MARGKNNEKKSTRGKAPSRPRGRGRARGRGINDLPKTDWSQALTTSLLHASSCRCTLECCCGKKTLNDSPFKGYSMVPYKSAIFTSKAATSTSKVPKDPPPDLKSPSIDVTMVSREENDGCFMCALCSQRFHSEDEFNAHISAHKSTSNFNSNFECLVCANCAFDTCSELLAHMDMCHEDVVTSQSVRCRQCDLAFGSCEEMYAHTTEHHKDLLKHF